MRAGQTTPGAGITPMLKGVLAALIGGLGSLRGAVIGGFALGLAEVMLRPSCPGSIANLTDGVVFLLIALLFIFRPGASSTSPRRAGLMSMFPDLRRDIAAPVLECRAPVRAFVGIGLLYQDGRRRLGERWSPRS
jgi:hypothetical protein